MAASFRLAVAVLRDALTRAVAGLTEMEARILYSAGDEISVTWLIPILALTTPHWALNDTRTPFYRIPRSVPSVLGFLVLGLHNFGRRVLS